MALPPVPNAVKCIVYNLWDGQETNNDLWFVGPSAEPSVGDLNTLADLVATWWISAMLPLLGQTLVFTKVRAQSKAVVDGPIVDIFGTGETGGVTSETAPNNVDPCISLRTAVGGRSGHGRNFVPGIPNADITGNVIGNSWIGSVTDAYSQLLPGGTSDPTPFVFSVVSYFSGSAVRPTPFSWPITHVGFVDNIVDSQRRRLPGRGK